MYSSSEEEEDDGGMGATWQMEDVTGGTLFTETYQVSSATTLPSSVRSTVEYGNKIVMPASALDALSKLSIMYPMMFRVTSESNRKSTFCGVLEFSAPEGVVFLPPWMMKTLKIRVGDLVELSNVSLPLGVFIKIQPQSVDFLDITDPRAVLEHSLRNFATLTVGDRIAINYNQKIYEMLIQEAKPNDGRGGISVLETDLQVDFAPPVGYEEPASRPSIPFNQQQKNEKSIASSLDLSANGAAQLSTSAVSSNASFAPFSGSSNRLSSKPKTLLTKEQNPTTTTNDVLSTSAVSNTSLSAVGPSPLNLPKGTLFFGSSATTNTATADISTNKNNNSQSPSLSSPLPSSTLSTTMSKEQEQQKQQQQKFTAFSGKPQKLQ